MARSTRQAFTVVELLVVIAIIGVLAALILPAVGMAREMARKGQCASQLKQWGVAAQSFETAKQVMPPLRSFPVNRNVTRPANIDLSATANNPNAQSWVHPLLPYVDRADLYEMIEGLNSGGSLTSLNFQTVKLPLAICGSDVSDTAPPNRSSYAANGGRLNTGSTSGTNPLDWPANGVIADLLKGGSDTFQIFTNLTKSDLSRGDGSTNTLMYLENADVQGWNVANNERDVACVWSRTGTETYGINMSNDPNTGTAVRRLRKTGEPFTNMNARPSSFHPNGFNACFADGNVKFLADSIDYSVYCQLMTSNSRELKEPSSNSNTPAGAYSNPLTATSY